MTQKCRIKKLLNHFDLKLSGFNQTEKKELYENVCKDCGIKFFICNKKEFLKN